MEQRRAQREEVLTLLYQAQSRDISVSELIDHGEIEPSKFTKQFALGVEQFKGDLDQLISERLDHWTLDRVAVIDLIVLRMGAYELIKTDTDRSIVINEAVVLAKRFSTDDSGAFVNGVLSKIA